VCSAGTKVCSNGVLSCLQNQQPSAEVCDGQDNDCNGTADDNPTDAGQACNTGQSGVCSAGIKVCSNGTLSCQQNQQPLPEVCSDGLDNDCNGTVDDGCVPTGICGDGILDAGEQCDDGNTDNGDGCSAGCTLEKVIINDRVTFVPLRPTFASTRDTTGCPSGFVGKFSFDARLTNISEDSSLSDLMVEVANITNGNLLQNADGGAGGVGAMLTAPKMGAYSDGVLSPGEFVDVPFVICLQMRTRFEFFVDVLGIVLDDMGM